MAFRKEMRRRRRWWGFPLALTAPEVSPLISYALQCLCAVLSCFILTVLKDIGSLTRDLWPLRPAGHPRGERVWSRPQLMSHPHLLMTNDGAADNVISCWTKVTQNGMPTVAVEEAEEPSGLWRSMWPVYIIASVGAPALNAAVALAL